MTLFDDDIGHNRNQANKRRKVNYENMEETKERATIPMTIPTAIPMKIEMSTFIR